MLGMVGMIGLGFDDESSTILTFARPSMKAGEAFAVALAARLLSP